MSQLSASLGSAILQVILNGFCCEPLVCALNSPTVEHGYG